MKILLRSTLLLCLSLLFGKPILAQPSLSPATAQPTLLGTWSTDFFSKEVIIIFDKAGTINVLGKKTYSNYEYYQFPDAEEYGMMQQIANGKFVIDPSPKYKVQDNLVEITISNGSVDQWRLDFTNNGRTVNFTAKDQTKPSFSFQRVSENSELPQGTEPLATVESHFNGLHKLVALQVAQANYWIQKKRFATTIQGLKVKSLPDSDRSYRYELIKQNPRQSTIAAIPLQPNLRSYVLQLDRIGLSHQPFNGIICATDRPFAKLLPLPQLKKNGLTCPAATHNVDFGNAIRQSLLKTK
jgi:Type IV pilin-like G and H, putative